MGLFDNGFVRACKNGFGMDNAAFKAVGWTILTFLFIFILMWYCLKAVIWICKKLFSKKKQTMTDAEYARLLVEGVPNFKQGQISIEILSCSSVENLIEGLLKVTGYNQELAEKVANNLPAIAMEGFDRQSADDMQEILAHHGATTAQVSNS